MDKISFIPLDSLEHCDGCPGLYKDEVDHLHGTLRLGCLFEQTNYENCEFQKEANSKYK
jgi:hypothetical protein